MMVQCFLVTFIPTIVHWFPILSFSLYLITALFNPWVWRFGQLLVSQVPLEPPLLSLGFRAVFDDILHDLQRQHARFMLFWGRFLLLAHLCLFVLRYHDCRGYFLG